MWRSGRTWNTSESEAFSSGFLAGFQSGIHSSIYSTTAEWALHICASLRWQRRNLLQKSSTLAQEDKGMGREAGLHREKRERWSNGLDPGFRFGVLLEAEGSPLECEREKWLREVGGDRKAMETEKQSVLFHLHMWESGCPKQNWSLHWNPEDNFCNRPDGYEIKFWSSPPKCPMELLSSLS